MREEDDALAGGGRRHQLRPGDAELNVHRDLARAAERRISISRTLEPFQVPHVPKAAASCPIDASKSVVDEDEGGGGGHQEPHPQMAAVSVGGGGGEWQGA